VREALATSTPTNRLVMVPSLGKLFPGPNLVDAGFCPSNRTGSSGEGRGDPGSPAVFETWGYAVYPALFPRP